MAIRELTAEKTRLVAGGGGESGYDNRDRARSTGAACVGAVAACTTCVGAAVTRNPWGLGACPACGYSAVACIDGLTRGNGYGNDGSGFGGYNGSDDDNGSGSGYGGSDDGGWSCD